MPNELIPPNATPGADQGVPVQPSSPPGRRAQVRPTGLPTGMTEADMDMMRGQQDPDAVSPEEQEQYDQVVSKSMRFIHGEKTQAALLRQLNHPSKEVFELAASAAVQLLEGIAQQAKTAGDEISPDVLYHAAADYVLPEIFEIGEAAKIFPIEPDSQEEAQQMEMALVEGVRLAGEKMLQGPDAQKHSEAAQNLYAQEVAKEADAGTLDPGFVQDLKAQSGSRRRSPPPPPTPQQPPAAGPGGQRA